MKFLLGAICFAGAAVMSGCAFHEHAIVLDAVGPPSLPPAAAGPKGALVVHTAHDPNADFDDLPYLRQFTDYKVFTEEGKLLQVVHNNNGSLVEDPLKVELPAGKYRLLARANGYGTVMVPVVILADQLTTVHLEGSPSWPDNAALLQSNPVRLPNGEIAGWRADTEVVPKP